VGGDRERDVEEALAEPERRPVGAIDECAPDEVVEPGLERGAGVVVEDIDQ
jgi:hypothetical protein